MSTQRAYPIACPRCRAQMEATLYESVNVKTDPALRDRLMANQLNQVTCPECAFVFRVDKNLVYCDPDRRLLVYWVPTPEDNYAAGEAQFAELIQRMTAVLPADLRAPDVHLVFSRIELVERIFLVEAGLNERIVEYIKYIIYTNNGGRLDPRQKILLFNAQDSTPEHLCFVIQDATSRKLEAMLQYDRKAYEAMRETFAAEERSADLLELFPGPYVNARALLLKDPPAEDPAPPAEGPVS